ncbi:VWA domain-containing protein [Granulicella sp. dw_53]|uniref:VWA domain-containing protein n=1 Tax=Granulicella sp. dw_53 TaxID=2719792 RepID=UPI001C49E69C|nr:VWA domain-containing protein [Granulicella sp. dw_53]
MLIGKRVCILLTALFSSVTAVSGQEIPGPASATSQSLRFDVVVSLRSGPPISGLEQQNFALSDNKLPLPIKAFKAVNSGQEHVKVILVIDAVNTGFSKAAYVREEVQKFLRANGGHLAYPTTIAIVTDKGAQLQKDFSSDGNALSTSLDRNPTGLRQITRSSGIWGANERVQISLTAVRELTAYAATIPGRKIILWISPGWPLLSGTRIELDSRQQQQIFGNVVTFSENLQRSDITLYNVNPLGPGESLFRADYYQSFAKGVSRPTQTDLADLSLQVLSIQSGGLVINGNNGVAHILESCLVDAQSWYEITFDAPVSDRPNEYHHVEITVDRPGLRVRTRDGYYAQP